jgi:histone H3/H4
MARLPAGTVRDLVSEELPDGWKAGREVHAPLTDAMVEFIEMVCDKANTATEEGKVASVRPQQILDALKELGFGRYEAEVSAVWEREKAARKAKSSRRKKGNSLQQSGLTMEELQARQQALFAKAKAKNG